MVFVIAFVASFNLCCNVFFLRVVPCVCVCVNVDLCSSTIHIHTKITSFIKGTQEYRKGTSIRQAPVFRHLRALRKSPWKFLS